MKIAKGSRDHLIPTSQYSYSCQYQYLKIKTLPREVLTPSLIEVDLFIKSKDCGADIQGTKLHGGCDVGMKAYFAACPLLKTVLSAHWLLQSLKDVPNKPHRIPMSRTSPEF